MKIKKIAASLCYLLFLSLFIFQIYLELKQHVVILPQVRMVIIFFFSVMIFSATTLLKSVLKKDTDKRKAVRICILFLFAVYLFNLGILLFLDTGFRLHGYRETLDYNRYLRLNTNFKPFATIHRYYQAFIRHRIGIYYVIVNLAGNLFAFAPFGFFLPVLSKQFLKFRNYIPITAIIIVFCEAVQFYYQIGSCDIDDFILNFTGAFLFFLILRTKWVQTYFAKHHITELK
ncbi:MAG: VanZ family protein [Clostridiales bacterium]|nr:VanZ family protein [Clostridiales bacterium]